jgi:carbonic anhydrase
MGRPLSRRGFIGSIGAGAAAALSGGGLVGAADALAADRKRPSTPNAALDALRDGNARYRSGHWVRKDYSPVGERRASSQKPFAAILGCADSRISPALIFDVERGNLFAAQVAGNTAADSAVVGSLEYAVAVLGVHLIMVLGHSDCGAVKAAIDVAAGTASYPASTYGAIGAMVDQVVPSIQAVDPAQRTLDRCIAVNASVQAQALARTGPIIPAAIAASRLRVVAARYDIATGTVELV